MTRPGRVLALAALAAIAAPEGAALAQSAPCEIDLGGGVGVRRATRPCYHRHAGRRAHASQCSSWSPVGFTFGDHAELEGALAFTRTARGRILALFSVGRLGILEGAVTYSDDLGETWHSAQWPSGGGEPAAIAFDPYSARGAAVGVGGSIWSTEDDGARWRLRRTSAAAAYVAVWVRGRSVVVQDAAGLLWHSCDGGFALESLAGRGARVAADGDDLLVVEPTRVRRIDRHGTLHAR